MANEVAKKPTPEEVNLTRPVGEIKLASSLFKLFEKELEKLLPKHIPVETLLAAAINSIRKDVSGRLLKCTRLSMLSALAHCAETGLIPDTPAQECHLVPFFNKKANQYEVVWEPGWRGLNKLARQSGEVVYVNTDLVYDGDFFDYERGLNPKLVHKPQLTPEREEKDILYAYAIAWPTDTRIIPDFEVMSKAQVDKIRNGSQQKAGLPWTNHYDEMARKTVNRRIGKRLPQSPALARALELDNQADADGVQSIPGVLAEMIEDKQKPKTEKIADELEEKAAKIKNAEEAPADAPEPLDTEHEEVPPEAEIEAPEPPEEATEGEREEVRPEGQEPEDFTKLLKARFSAIPTEAYTDLLKKYAPQRIKAWTPAARSQEYAALVDKINEYEAAEKTAAAKG